MIRLIPTMVIMGFGFLLSSCLTPSEQPILLESGTEVASSPYLGEWVLTERGGESLDWTVSVDIIQDATQMLIATSMLESLSPINVYFFLTRVNDDVIFCIQHPASGFWNLLVGTLEENNTRLSLRRLDESVIESDILDEDLEGFSRIVADREAVLIRASGSDLRTYIENTTSAFEEEPFLVFEKVDP